MSKILSFAAFLVKTFASKPLSSAKNHRGDLFYILKILSELIAICQLKKRGRTTRRSENIEANVKKPLKKPLEKKVPCIPL